MGTEHLTPTVACFEILHANKTISGEIHNNDCSCNSRTE